MVILKTPFALALQGFRSIDKVYQGMYYMSYFSFYYMSYFSFAEVQKYFPVKRESVV